MNSTSASVSCADSFFCIDRASVKMEPSNDYEESVIVIKQEINSDDENESNDMCYEYIDTSGLKKLNDDLTSSTENSSVEGRKLSLQNSDTTKYIMICENDKDDSGVLHFRLLNEEPLTRPFKTVARSVEDNRQTKFKTKACIKKDTARSIKLEHDIERPFKCDECDETFEVKSHLVMHEIAHERYKKYKESKLSSAVDAIKQPILHMCKECGACFESKYDLLRHKTYHENDMNAKCMCKKSLRTTSDLCKCFVRECQSCHRKFFAAIKLGNWTACIRCFFLNDSEMKHLERTEESDDQNCSLYPNVKAIDITQIPIESSQEITNVKKLCYSCGKMCSNVISAGISWLCYSCWNTKIKERQIRRITNRYPQLRRKLKYKKTDCVYCLKLFPFESLRKDHQCLHRSVYLKDEKKFLQRKIKNDGYTEVRLVDDDKIGQHFLLESSLQTSVLPDNYVGPKYTSRTLVIPSKPILNCNLGASSSKQLTHPQSVSWDAYSDDDGGGGIEMEEEYGVSNNGKNQVIEAQDDDSPRTLILCDKTGELIDLNLETAELEQN